MQQSATMRRTSARTAIAIMLAVVGMLALGGAWSSATAAPGNSDNDNSQGNGPPADGSVGNADDKTPGGQSNGDNPNKGYECDDNQGVGKGNPAHTGCTTSTTSQTGSSGCVGVCDTTTTTTTTVPGEEPSAEVLGLTEEAPAAPGAAPAAAPATQLAFTGITADVLGFLGLALVAFGAAFMLVARRNEESLFGTATHA
jgi:hypothetical protein